MKLSFVPAVSLALVGAVNATRHVGRQNIVGEQELRDDSACPRELTPPYVVGVWQGSISHTLPQDNYLQHSRITFHSDGTFIEHHEYYQPSVPTFPTSVLISVAQGYWRISGRNQLETDIYIDSEFGPDAGPEAGIFFTVAHLNWNGTYNRHTCNVSGEWTGKLYTSYDSQAPTALGPAGEIIYKKIQPAW